MDRITAADELVKRTGVSYEDAKAALEATGWNTLDAVIYLENNGKTSAGGKLKKAAGTAGGVLRKAFNYCRTHKLEIISDKGRIAEMPLTAAVILSLLLFELVLPAAIIALLFGISFGISGENAQISRNDFCGFDTSSRSNSVNLNKN